MRSIASDSFPGASRNPRRDPLQERHASPELPEKELQHCVRNLLGVVQCLVAGNEANTADNYRAAVNARIDALSDACSLIEGGHERRVTLMGLLERTLGPHAAFPSDRIVLAGPDVALAPHDVLSLHMVFGELATNAGKYGALSSRSGSVEVLWDVLARGCSRALAIQWRERGGPKVRKPEKSGVGIRLIAKALSRAQIDLDFAPAGLVCRVLLEIDPTSNLGEWIS
jgi:two-component sensor histidine kinase